MALLQLGYPEVPKSITNPNVNHNDALDVGTPMSFLVFIKNITSSFDPEILQKYYNEYLKRWNLVANTKETDKQQTIVDRYREFIQEVTLNYTTLEEKKFLQKLDLTDPLDLDIAIPFFSRKLVEICKYYNQKREESKFELTRKKLKGSNTGVGTSILQLTLNYLENLQDGKIYFNIDEIKSKIEVEIEELYDSYPFYFNQTPNVQVYDNKDLDYGQDIFLQDNTSLINEVFAGVSTTLKGWKEADQVFDTKRELTKKYISTDFYYLSTGSTVTDFLSGKVFDNYSSSQNFLNRDYPTTASTDRLSPHTPREKGFFRPHKTAIILIDGKNHSFSFNFDNLKPNSIYYFPDPLIIGHNGDVLTFIVDDESLKRNNTSGKAANQPSSSSKDSTYFGYHSKIEPSRFKYLDHIFESGYIQDAKFDIYNNLYGLFKNNNNFHQGIVHTPEKTVKSILLNGHTFYDELYGEGYDFNFNTFDNTTYPTTIRAGFSTYTNSFVSLTGEYTLLGRFFQSYDELYVPSSSTLQYELLEGAFLMDGTNFYPDSMSSDLSAFPGSGTYYYDTLIEGGITTLIGLEVTDALLGEDGDSLALETDEVLYTDSIKYAPVRALLDPLYPTLTASMTVSMMPDGIDYFLVDGGILTDYFNIEIPTISLYDDTVINTTTYTVSSYNTQSYWERTALNGNIYVKNGSTGEILPLLEAFPYFTSILAAAVIAELSYIKNFEIVNDVLCMETANYFIMTKVLMENGEFINPKAKVYVLHHNQNPFQKLSKRYKLDQYIYYGLLNVASYPLTANEFLLYPTVYELNTTSFEQKIYNQTITSQSYLVSAGNVRYERAETPTFTYNSRNNLFNMSFLLKDQNNMFRLQEIDFEINPFNVISNTQYDTRVVNYSNIFTTSYNSTLNVFMSASPVVVQNNIIII